MAPVSSWRARVRHVLHDFFERVGVAVATRPWHFIVASLLVVGVLASGVSQLETVGDYQLAWTPKRSQAWGDKQWYEANFGQPPRYFDLILARRDGGNVLQQGTLLQAQLLHERVLATKGVAFCTCSSVAFSGSWWPTQAVRSSGSMIPRDAATPLTAPCLRATHARTWRTPAGRPVYDCMSR